MKKVRVAIIGGGRWARVYLSVLMAHRERLASIAIVSPRNAAAMRASVEEEPWPTDIPVLVLERIPEAGIDCAIIVNAAAEHESTAAKLLRLGIPVLIEKPFALSTRGADALIALSKSPGAVVAAAHVLLFARYLGNFAHALMAIGEPARVEITWRDGTGESRHRERKNYDASLPVVADVLPHIVSILEVLWPGMTPSCSAVIVGRGGAKVELDLMLGVLPCRVHLARNSTERARLILVEAGRDVVKLDFTQEPGRITRGSDSWSGADDWNIQPSPLTQLVASFLDQVAGGQVDRRLDASLGRRAAELIDAVLPHYDNALIHWLRAQSGRQEGAAQDIGYTKAELADDTGNADGRPGEADVEGLVAKIERRARAVRALDSARSDGG